ncbi:UbiA family prenyltransferase [Halalkalicoccus jeotgali]|uniref:Prenyltransferase n=1 Tax=Halalkalicoccus jeotgali (strain DSM 18796 / CECT 7217 / JCM 14584 / KCTC 4019 / B3) TaxID=795797 RepID=D8J2G1_HALJB|nr:UbiA family prenyltransferase [Halalkalicoccus jeotgali]ADJ14918.1 prenyltransferase [Halalkalicoccus jeotgali B3]ELY35066.1 prenyltransferase [Halalkalicoccus jeotgali B3]
MVRLSIANGDELRALRRWLDHLRGTRPVAAAERTYALCVQCSLLLAVIGASKVAVVSLLLSIPINAAAGVAFLVTLAVYNHNKLTDLEEDAVNDPEGAALRGSRKRLFAALSVGSYVLALCLSALGGPVAFSLTLFPGVLGVLYSSRWLPGPGPDRLKDVLLVGTGAVAFAWAVPLALLPLAFAGDAVGLGALVVLAFFFVRTVLAVELFNVRDVEGDRCRGIATLPVVLGVDPTRVVLVALNACSLALLVAAVFLGALAPVALAAAPAVGFSLVLVGWLDADRSADRLCLASYLEAPLMAACLVLASGSVPPVA